ncbi:uncharacterized protein LOC113352131 [Papaver somniferum]|uniref:uncharacterized protein LOC113352131 n=1 Tax=Papaver somniferum TaxID=3469 RepID=UPI000E700559|nr:uncharacterized protein LOC113352131 [Papaver somniferum]
MRVFWWNAQGLAKDGARSKLTELYHLHNPDIICVAEPHVFCTLRLVRKLNLVNFCEDVITNEANGEKANLWILWRNSLARTDVLSSSKQAITLNVAGDFVTAVHASFDLVARRRLWHQLNLGFIFIPWLVLGDFNCILRLDEKKGGRPIKEMYVNEFKSWISDNGLVEADAIGKNILGLIVVVVMIELFQSMIERTVFGEVQFRLKQAELKLETENDLLDFDHGSEFQFVKVADAQKAVDDVKTELAVMLKMKSRDEINDYIVNHYQAKFNGGDVNIDPRLFDIDHESISDAESAFMDAIPSLEEVKEDVFDLGADSAPGPDGFIGSFYIQCWNIISKDLFNAIANCWAISKIPNGINSSLKVLIPKNNKYDAIKDYRPIGLRRNIHENIALASELIDEIGTERKHGNVGIKLDITQAFDTDMLGMYQRASGQYVSYAKNKFYYGGGTGSRAISIANYLGMERAFFPDKYLGIQLNPGIVRHIHVRQVVEKIMDKLAGWKSKLLSFQARLVLIRSVISSYVIHSMAVYKWPCTVIKQVEKVIRNFIWSGDAEKLKYFTILYDDLCCSRREGGLGLKKLLDVNRAMLMKLWVSIRDSDKIWARFLREKYFNLNGNLIDYKLGSSVFPGIRLRLGIFSKGPNDFTAKVSDILVDGAWAIPPRVRDLMIHCNIDIENLPLIAGGDDYKIWDLDYKGVFSVKSTKASIKAPAEVLPIASLFTREVEE